MYIHRDKKRYALCSAIPILMGFVGYFYMVFQHFEDSLLRVRLAAVTFEAEHFCNMVDYLVERDGGWEAEKYKEVFVFLVGRMDATSNSYAELLDEQLNKLSERVPVFQSRTFDPREFPDFVNLLLAEDIGNHVILFDPMDGKTAPHDLYLHWRWVPTGKNYENRLLLIVGCTKYSVNTQFAAWIGYGLVALIVVTAMYVIASIMVLTVDRRRNPNDRKEKKRV